MVTDLAEWRVIKFKYLKRGIFEANKEICPCESWEGLELGGVCTEVGVRQSTKRGVALECVYRTVRFSCHLPAPRRAKIPAGNRLNDSRAA